MLRQSGGEVESWRRSAIRVGCPRSDGVGANQNTGYPGDSHPLDLQGGQLLSRFVAAAYERRSLGIASHWPFDAWGRFLPEHTTATSLLDRLLHHAVVVVTEGDS